MEIKYLIAKFIDRVFPKNLSKEDKDKINNSDSPTLAKWYNELNRWEWPNELPPSEPPIHLPNGRRGKLMDLIESKVGNKYLLHYHNVIKGKRMTDAEFEDFWKGNYEGDVEAKERYFNRLHERAT